jgi:hypothetical protein
LADRCPTCGNLAAGSGCTTLSRAGLIPGQTYREGDIKMTADIIDGKAFAATVRTQVSAQVARLKAEHGITPGLG